MSSYDPPTINSNIFNDSYFTSLDGSLSIQTADLRYLKLTGGIVRGETTFSSNLNILGSLSYNSNIIDLNLLFGITPGTALASKAVILDATTSISGLNNITFSGSLAGSVINASQYLLSGTPINFSAITGVTAGTAAASKALIVDANRDISNIGVISQSVATGGDMHVLAFTTASSRASIKFTSDISTAEFGIRGSTAGSYPNTYYMYSNGSYKWTMDMANGDTKFLSTTDTSSVSTGSLILSGGLAVTKNLFCTGILTLNRNGSNISIINGSNSGLIELPASPNILRLVRGFSLNIGSNGLCIENGSVRDPRYNIDLGATAGDIKICLFDGGGGVYGLGANNSRMQYISGGSNGHSFYKTTNNTLGTLQAEFNIDNNFICTNNIIANTGLHCYGFNTAGLNNYGMGLHAHYASSKAQIFAYNYNNGTYGQMSFQNDYFCITSSGTVNVGGSSPTSTLFPLHVQTAINYNLTGGYGYLNAGGSTGSGSSTGSVGFSLFCAARIAASEIDIFSDRKLKSNIKNLELNDCYDFMKINAKSYNFKTETDRSLGFIAQDIISCSKKEEIQNIVTVHPEENALEFFDEETGILSPAGFSMSVKYNNVAVIHHEIIKDLMKKIDDQEYDIRKNEELINNLLAAVKFLKDRISLII
jgi:hypothetical protein